MKQPKRKDDTFETQEGSRREARSKKEDGEKFSPALGKEKG
jgi:hypothetical protein